MELISSMMIYDPNQRPSYTEILFHPWMTMEELPTEEEVKVEMEWRLGVLTTHLEEEKKESEPDVFSINSKVTRASDFEPLTWG